MKQHRTLAIILLAFVFAVCQPTHWSNWGNTQKYFPQQIFSPSTIQEVIAIIQEAAAQKTAIKAIGSSHSWSDLINTNGFLITTDQLNKILWIDHAKCHIKVEAGIKLKDLIKLLAENRLALSNQGFIAEQSIAGAIATATHGTGKAYCLSDYIIAMEVIDAAGNLHTISEESHPEWLGLARVALGALGFIYSVTIQCEPAFNLKHTRTLMDLTQVIANYQQFYDDHDYFMFMLTPSTQSALVYFWDRTPQDPNTRFLHYIANDCVFNRFLNCITIKTLSHLRSISPFMLSAGLTALQMNAHIEYSYKSLSPMKTPLTVQWYIEQEFAVDFKDFPAAFADLMKIYKKYDPTGYGLASIITCRFGPASERSYLNPAFGRKTAYLTINTMTYFDEYQSFFEDLEHAMIPYQGRPHWGKYHLLNQSKIAQLYNPDHIQKFNELRKLLDPEGLFENDFVKRCFGSL